MAGRNHIPPRHQANFHGPRGGPRPILNRGNPGNPSFYPVNLEEELEIQHRENHKILAENRHLLDENVNLERELVAAKDEVQRLDELIMKLRADNNIKYRDLVERSLKLEADVRAVEPLREEVVRLRAESQKLNVLRQELTGQIQGLTSEIARLRSENKQFSGLRADVDGIHKELVDARRALEYEKKANEKQLEQKDAMEKNLMSMSRELEKLRAEKIGVDRRGHGFGGSSGYAMYNGVQDMRYPGGGGGVGSGGGAFDDGYGGNWGPYSKRPRR